MESDEGTLAIWFVLGLPAAIILLFVAIWLWRRKFISELPLEGRMSEVSEVILSMTNRSKKMLDHPDHIDECHSVAIDALALAWSRDNTQPWLIGIAYHTLALSENNRGWGNEARDNMLKAYNILSEWPGCQLAERVQREVSHWIRHHDGQGEGWKNHGD